MSLSTFIALLRGINVTGRNKIPMVELQEACTELGWQDVQSYIQSGNLVFTARAVPADLETALEEAIQHRFNLTIPVIVRPAAVWTDIVKGNPFPEASQREPNLVMLALSKSPPKPGAAAGLQERAQNGERVLQGGDSLWVHYPGGSGRSKLSPALFDRLTGSPVTARNWRTVLKLEELAGQFRSKE